MKTWLLIVIFSWHQGGGPLTVEGFTSLERCEIAGKKIVAEYEANDDIPKWYKHGRYTCTEVTK